MKLWVVTKRKLGILLGLFFTICGLGIVLAACTMQQKPEVQATAVTPQRQVPIYAVETDEKKIAISFDAAWGNEQTTQLLQTLETYGVKTTFFVVGDWVEKYPESVAQIHQAGHEVCNHSDTHPHMPQLSQAQQAEELERCNQKIAAITGQTPKLFRPPYGDYDNTVLQTAKQLQMDTIQWDVDSLDWKELSAAEITQRVVSQVKNGSIVLFHNGGLHTPEALPTILEALQKEGYSIVPISELIYHENYTINPNTGLQQRST